jgi:hypothetical protein
MDRRDFLKTTATAAVLAGPAVIGARGANDKINIGWIGVGTRGNAGIDWLKKAAPDTVTITAICDTFQGYLARGKDRVQTIWGNTPATYNNYHDLLADRSIDAVFIMTPEHLHHDMAIAALRAGKHVYLEKPLAHTIEEGFDIVREWKKSGKIVQVGTQNRSSSLYKKAKEMVKQGMIGDVHFVRAFWYRNSTDDNPAWRYVTGPSSWGRRRSGRGTRTVIINGGCTGITRAASPPTCWYTRPTSSTSCWTAPCRWRAWRRAASTAGPARVTTATPRTPSAPSTNTRANCRSTIPAISATINTVMASSCAAMKAPSK